MPTLEWRCVSADDAVSELIRFVSRGRVSHIEFVFGAVSLGAHADGGVARRPLNNYPVDLRYQAVCTDEQYAAAMAFLEAQIGKPYDFADIADIVADRDWHDPSRWICSELWIAALEAAKIVGAIDGSINLFTPEDGLIVSGAMFEKLQ